MSAAQRRRQEVERRRQMAEAVRLSPAVTPELAAVVETVRQELGPGIHVEAYVRNAPETQALSIAGGSKGLAFVVLTSGLLRLLRRGELAFVLGHELGHAVFKHHGYPDALSAQTEAERLNLLMLQRAAEISADRIGFLASPNIEECLWAILKLASGLPRDLLRCDVASYLDQLRDLQDRGGSEYELLSSHPMFTARVRALLWFEMSDVYYEHIGRERSKGLSLQEVDKRIGKDLAAAGGFRLAEVNEQAARDALMWGLLNLFAADKRLTKGEQALLERIFGVQKAEKVIAFVRESGANGISSKFEASLRSMRLLSEQTRTALYQDLVRLSAQASGEPEARARLLRIVADRLSLGTQPGES